MKPVRGNRMMGWRPVVQGFASTWWGSGELVENLVKVPPHAINDLREQEAWAGRIIVDPVGDPADMADRVRGWRRGLQRRSVE